MIGSSLATLDAQAQHIKKYMLLAQQRAQAARELCELDEGLIPQAAKTWAAQSIGFPLARSFEASMAAVLIYGALEAFIRDLAAEYLQEYTLRLQTLEKIPKKILSTQFELTMEYLKLSTLQHYRGTATTEELAKSLLAGLVPAQNQSIVFEPLLRHTSNFRLSTIDEYFNRIAVSGVCRGAAMLPEAKAYAAITGFEAVNGEHERLWRDIDDLVEHRNMVAHGDLSNTLSWDTLLDYCTLISIFGQTLTMQVQDTFCSHLHQEISKPIGSPVAIFGGNVVCVNTNGVGLKIGDTLCILSGAGYSHSALIKEIQHAGRSVTEAADGDNISVGLRVDRSCRMNHKISLLGRRAA